MDNLAHTLVGAALAESGLRRRTALGAATLLIGANFPDIDVVAVPLGRGIELRRGWTHGVLALVLLPFVLTGLMLAWDRLARSRAAPPRADGGADAAPAVRPGQLLVLAALSIATHPLLDWMNTYGVRWLMPFDGRWFYGDTLFIVDPWIWLALAAGVVFARRRRAAGAPAREWVRPARWALAAAGAYAAVMLALGAAGRGVVGREIGRRGLEPAGARLMVAPVPVTPFARQVVYGDGETYYLGRLTWLPAPRLTMGGTVPRVAPREAAAVARDAVSLTRAGHVFVGWARFPFFVVEGAGDETAVRIGDLRYTRDARDSWAAITVRPPAAARAAAEPADTAGASPYLLLSEITARTSEADLARRFGAANVVRGAVGLGEGETTPGTILFPTDSARRLEIVWGDTAARAAPRLAQAYGPRSRWAIAPGVTLGTTLAELERANARPFTLTGFGWDYSGTVTSWRGGRLDSLQAAGRRLIVRLAPLPDESASADAGALAGDREFPSGHPAMRRLNPRVYEIGVLFE